MRYFSLRLFLAAAVAVSIGQNAAAQISWDGGNATFVWGDNGNWNPDGSPAGMAVSIGNLAAATNDTTLIDAAYSINSLTITNGADVVNSTDSGATNDFELVVNGNTTVSDAGSSIVIFGGDPDGLDTNNLTIGNGGQVVLNSTTAQGTAVVEVDGDTGTGLFSINTGGTLGGTGRIDLEAAPVAATSLIVNDGSIIANTPALFFAPPAGTLRLNATSANARFDWDGPSGNGVLQANGNQTLDIDVAPGVGAIADAFSGVMNLGTGSTIDISTAWELDAGMINANTPDFGPIIIGQDPDPGPAAHIAGAAWTMSGGTINVDDTWDSLQFDSALTASGGTVNNSGTMIFNAAATFQSGVDFNMDSALSSLVVNAVVNIDTPDFALDGAGGAGSATINAGGILDLDLGAGADLIVENTINLNGGELDLTTSAATAWTIANTVNAAGGAASTINSAGETLNISGDINVTANSTLVINSVTNFTSTAVVVIDAGSTLNMGTTTYNGGSYSGAGLLRPGTATIAAATTWGVGTVKLDDGVLTINANLTVNTNAVDTTVGDGYDGSMTIADGTLLTVNIDGGGAWTVDPAGDINYNGGGGSDTFLAGSNIILNGMLNVNLSSGQTNAVLNIGSTGTVNLNAGLRLNAGDNAANSNTIAGGTVNGPGTLSAGSTRALIGFGTINAPIDFDGGGTLKADDGTMTLSGAIIDVGLIGTRDTDAILNVVGAWNSSVADFVDLIGGELTGGTITIDNAQGITGFGLVSARVINNQRIHAVGAPVTLVVQEPGNNNDWDGTLNNGSLNASAGNLEVRDNASFPFGGTVNVGSGRLFFANGFEIEFEPGSSLNLTGGTYRSTNATDIGGTVTIGAGTSALQITGTTIFESGSNTTITGNLQLDNSATRINSGATFSGGGTLVNMPGRTLTLIDGADVDVLLENRGTLVLGASPGQTTGLDFEQTAAGTWNVELSGTGINDYDRMTLTGLAQVDGTLNLSLIGGYVPTLADPLLTILSASSVSGTFDVVNQPPTMPPTLMFDVIYNAGNIQLDVVALLAGDYNRNGVVDAADYPMWRDTLGTAVTAFSGADGDGDGMIDDDDYGVWKANFGNVAGSGSAVGQSVAVPEPTAFLLVLLAVSGYPLCGRRGVNFAR